MPLMKPTTTSEDGLTIKAISRITMHENQEEQLYQIFRMAFQVLKEYSGSGNEATAAGGIVDCLNRLKNQNVPTCRQTNHKRDFYRWLAVQCLRVSLDPSLADQAERITSSFVEVLDVHGRSDPLIILDVINTFVDSLSNTLNVNGYFPRKGGTILVVTSPDLSEDHSSASVGHRRDLRPICLFFTKLIDGREDVLSQLDQTYTFHILTVFVQIYESFDRELGHKIITLFPHLVKALHPTNQLEWNVIYSVFVVFYSTIVESLENVPLVVLDSLLDTITYVVSNFTNMNSLLTKLILLLAVEASYTIALSDDSADLSPWIRPAIALMESVDFMDVELETIFPKLLATSRREYVPLIDSHLLSSLEMESQPEVANSTVIVEEKSPTWKLCLDIIKSVPTIAYTSTRYKRTLDLASDLVMAGRRISYLLKFKHKSVVFELFNLRSLRPLINVPFMIEECLSKPAAPKFASLVLYIKTMLALSSDFTPHPRLIDSHLVEHSFILFTLPWHHRYAEHFSDSVKCDCLDGIVNLTYVVDRDKFFDFATIFVLKICPTIIRDGSITVLNKMLSCLVFMAYNVSDAVVCEILLILKEYLSPEKLGILLNNEYVGHKLLCFISGCCTVKMGAENWELLCSDCDSLDINDATKFALVAFNKYLPAKFVELLSDLNFSLLNLNGVFLRFLNHSDRLRGPDAVKSFFTRSINETLPDSVLTDEILYRLVYNGAEADQEVVSKIYQTICSMLKKSKTGDFDITFSRYKSIIAITKKLLKLPCPSSMSVLKILMLYNMSPAFDITVIRALFKIALSVREETVPEFLKTHDLSLAKFTVNYMIHQAYKSDRPVASSFLDIMGVLNLKLDEIVGKLTLMSSILSEIVQKCKPFQSGPIIAQIAALFSEDVKSFLDKYYESIFASIYALDDDAITEQNLMPLFELTGLSFEKTLHWRYSQLVSKLILHSYHPLRVYRFLFRHKQNENVEQHLTDLKQHFIGCLTIIETDLQKNESLCTAKNYITCIYKCIQTFGFEIVASIQVKLLTTLRICLPLYYHTLPKHCLKAWTYFCFSVDVKTIGPYVVTILVHLLPLLDKFPDQVANIFHYFVVENGGHYPERLPSLYFVPCHPNFKMQQVWSVIQLSLLAKGSCCRNIFVTLEGIYSESTETKKVFLERLRMCLSDHSTVLYKSIKQDDETCETILTCLLDNITCNNDDVRILCASCLGELGAIDPTKFRFNDSHRAYTPQKYNLAADDFSVLCITKIVHCLRKYDDSNITHILYSTLQELLRLHLGNKSESEKSLYLEKFNVHDRYLLVPLLHSKYIFKGVAFDRKMSEITFEFHAGKTPCEWATIWATHMLFRMPPSTQRSVFSTCLPTMKIDIEVTEAVLPYILLYALVTCSQSDVELIEREMKYILQWDLTKHRTKPDNLMMIVGSSKKNIIHSDVSQTKYVSMVLDLLDFLNQVTSDCHFFKASFGLPNEDQFKEKIENFVKRFPERAMSLKSFVQEDYSRALYYIEKDSSDQRAVECLKPLRNIYSKLDDVNGLVGVVKTSSSAPSTEETIVNHMVYGSVHDALSGYERMCSKYQSTNAYRGLIQCYIEVNQPATALAISKQIINDDKYLRPDIFSEHVEALWSTSHYKEIDTLLEELNPRFSTGSMWNIDLVSVYRLLTKSNYGVVLDEIKNVRLAIVSRLANLNRNGMALYRQGYWYVVKLHILNDIETCAQMHFAFRPEEDDLAVFRRVSDRFDQRRAILPAHSPYIQDVTKSCLQTLSTVFDASKYKLTDSMKINISSSLGGMWLELAKKARHKRHLQEAYTCIGIAEKYEPPKLFIELAKYYQAKFETDTAVLVLERGLQKFDLSPGQDLRENQKICADATLLIAQFQVGSMNLDFNDGYVAFKKAVNICNLEKSFVRLATYLYKQHLTETEPDDTPAKMHLQLDAAQNFSKSLLYGTKHIYQSMPCILTLWLDFGARVATQLRTNRPTVMHGEMAKVLINFNRLIENTIFLLPTYMFMTAFSQILSRINHRHPNCLEILTKIIIKILKEYPQQAMWSFYSVCRSSDTTQRERTAEICKRIKGSDKEIGRFLKVFTCLAERLIDISMRKLRSDIRQVSLSQISPKLVHLMEEIRNTPIMLPLQKFLTVQISMRKTGDESNEQHTPFPLNPIYITDVKSSVMILISIQMPKRLEFVGSDGLTYPLMCKQDDLRLDSRFMEFNTIINTLLRTDSVACEKDLTIRTYSVVPLNSECGIIEWLNGLSSLKSIIVDMYAKLNIQTMTMKQVKKLMYVEKDQVTLQERLRRFVKEILPQHPPVLHKWFFARHPCPEEWLHCRNAFVRTSAVMSIVGYIVGLGDRHCENILIDSATGEAVHVDFNMLFNRSDVLKFPETVPFRLTHSMVRAMGATGVEGLFVNSAETTTRVVRHNSEQLLSVLKPFLYDIDVKSYNPRRYAPKKSAALVTDDMSNDEAKINIQNVEMRLNGVVRCKNNQWAPHRDSKPLSVEGQTRMLIKEATSDHNLCQMFVGWSPYL